MLGNCEATWNLIVILKRSEGYVVSLTRKPYWKVRYKASDEIYTFLLDTRKKQTKKTKNLTNVISNFLVHYDDDEWNLSIAFLL